MQWFIKNEYGDIKKHHKNQLVSGSKSEIRLPDCDVKGLSELIKIEHSYHHSTISSMIVSPLSMGM